MNKFLHVQILIFTQIVGIIVCQHYHHQQGNQHQALQAQSHFYIHQNHPKPTTAATLTPLTPHPTFHHQQNVAHQFGFQSTTATPPSYMDLDKFNQQAKVLKDQINYFKQQQSKHIRNQINSVHQDGNEPHFDFVINQNYSDLEKASEQFVNLGSMAAKQNMPKVIKITKTVAVKQPVPVPYPVPVVKFVKEPVLMQQSHYAHPTPTAITEKPMDFKPSPFYSNYTSYISKYPSQMQHSNEVQNNQVSSTPSTPMGMAMAHKIAESYIKQEFFSTPASLASIGEYDTRPFYVSTSEKEMIKYIPVPYYIDENGNRHDLPQSSSSDENETSNDQQFYKQPSADSHPGKFSSYTFSYHPPTHHTTPTPFYNHHNQQSSYSTPQPDTKYYYSQGEVASVPISSVDDNTISSSHHYDVSEVEAAGDEHEHVQYKYVYER